MLSASRQQILDALQTEWGTYVDGLKQMPAEAQAAFLEQQGYHRLADLLAHVMAWWKNGMDAIEHLIEDPDYHSPKIDVDDFNQKAVEGFRAVSEPEAVRLFDDTRAAMINLVANLDEAALQNPRITKRLYIEVIDHLGEHALPSGT